MKFVDSQGIVSSRTEEDTSLQEGRVVEAGKVDGCSAMGFHCMSWCATRRDWISSGADIGGWARFDTTEWVENRAIFNDERHHVPRLKGTRCTSEMSTNAKILRF